MISTCHSVGRIDVSSFFSSYHYPILRNIILYIISYYISYYIISYDISYPTIYHIILYCIILSMSAFPIFFIFLDFWSFQPHHIVLHCVPDISIFWDIIIINLSPSPLPKLFSTSSLLSSWPLAGTWGPLDAGFTLKSRFKGHERAFKDSRPIVKLLYIDWPDKFF